MSYDIAKGSGSVILTVVPDKGPTSRLCPGDPASVCSVVFSRPTPGSWNLRVRVDGEWVFEETGEGHVDTLQATRKVLEAAETHGHVGVPKRSLGGIHIAEYLLLCAYANEERGVRGAQEYVEFAMGDFLRAAGCPQIDYLAGVLTPSWVSDGEMAPTVGSVSEGHVRLYMSPGDGEGFRHTIYLIPSSPLVVACLLREASKRTE